MSFDAAFRFGASLPGVTAVFEEAHALWGYADNYYAPVGGEGAADVAVLCQLVYALAQPLNLGVGSVRLQLDEYAVLFFRFAHRGG